MKTSIYDYCVIGSGIVGLGTAYEISNRFPRAKILVVEKEAAPGLHQSGRNSGVIHAGIYYKPGSLKAKLCQSGLYETKRFCEQNNIKFLECGKLIVATNDLECERLESLYERGGLNGLSLDRITSSKLSLIEPNVTGREAILCSETAIVDYAEIVKKMTDILKMRNVHFSFSENVVAIHENDSFVELRTNRATYRTAHLVACAGIQSDRIAKLAGVRLKFKMIPFRGEYYALKRELRSIVNHLIYPVPDPMVPFLGIHLTRLIDGGVTVGPNAVLGLSREGYEKWSLSIKDVTDFLSFGGFWRLMLKHKNYAFHEIVNSISKAAYLNDCKKYCPTLDMNSLISYRAGIRAQAVMNSGELIHDFLFERSSKILHVCNAPSPAATSAIPIGRAIVNELVGS